MFPTPRFRVSTPAAWDALRNTLNPPPPRQQPAPLWEKWSLPLRHQKFLPPRSLGTEGYVQPLLPLELKSTSASWSRGPASGPA